MDTSDQGTMPPLKDFLLTFFMPEKCYDHFFIYFNFMHGELFSRINLWKCQWIYPYIHLSVNICPDLWKNILNKSILLLCYRNSIITASHRWLVVMMLMCAHMTDAQSPVCVWPVDMIFLYCVYCSLVPCLKIVLSKIMGIFILMGIVIGK